MLNELFERQDAIQSQVDKYTPIREIFEEFLKAGKREDEGLLWWVSPGSRRSRYSWERKAVLDIPEGRKIVVEASTDPTKYNFGYQADNIQRALIDVRVSLPKNPDVAKNLELPPAWAILEQPSDFSPQYLERLEIELEEIVPLVRACLSQDLKTNQ